MQYYVGKNGQQLGPFSAGQIEARIASGEFSANDMVWCEGMAGWEPAGKVFLNPYQPAAALGASPLFHGTDNRPLAGAGSRLGAVILNQLIMLAAILPGGLLLILGGGQSSDFSTLQLVGTILIVAMVVGLMIYQLMAFLKTGQTIGKRLMGVKVVRFQDGGDPGFGGLVAMREIVPAVIGMVPMVGTVFSIVDVCFVFREDRRCIHDLIANTKVVAV